MTTAVQTLTSFAIAVASVLAPVSAAELGMPAARVGMLVSIFFIAAIVSGLLSAALVRRYGPRGLALGQIPRSRVARFSSLRASISTSSVINRRSAA